MKAKAAACIVNRPFPAGAGRDEILGAFRTELVPAAERFKPELVMISAGFDSRAGDPLGKFTLTDADFAELTAIVVEIARQHARGRIVSVLEGGYSRDGLTRAVAAHLGPTQRVTHRVFLTACRIEILRQEVKRPEVWFC